MLPILGGSVGALCVFLHCYVLIILIIAHFGWREVENNKILIVIELNQELDHRIADFNEPCNFIEKHRQTQAFKQIT